jgi:hypothetical protein
MGKLNKLDARDVSRLIVVDMKKEFFALMAAAAIVATGCVHTVSDTSTFAMSPSRDTISGRYQRPWEQVYQAAVTVVQRNGVLTREYVPHEYTNTVRQLEGRVNDEKLFIRVEQVDPKVTQVDVEARSKWGQTDLDLVHEMEKEIALELAAH